MFLGLGRCAYCLYSYCFCSIFRITNAGDEHCAGRHWRGAMVLAPADQTSQWRGCVRARHPSPPRGQGRGRKAHYCRLGPAQKSPTQHCRLWPGGESGGSRAAGKNEFRSAAAAGRLWSGQSQALLASAAMLSPSRATATARTRGRGAGVLHVEHNQHATGGHAVPLQRRRQANGPVNSAAHRSGRVVVEC